jgi:subtilisin-like proprotein convertase family protein
LRRAEVGATQPARLNTQQLHGASRLNREETTMRSTYYNNGMRRLLAMARGMAVAAVLATSGAAWAVPNQVSLEGALMSSGGSAAPDGTYNVVFGIYKDAAGGNPVWSEGPVAVAVKNGLFAYAIGTKTPLTPVALANLSTSYLGIKVESDAELPRQQVLSTAYALRAGVAEGVDCSGCIAAAALDPSVLAPYAKTTDLAAYAKTASLKAVATSGAYADLTGLPVLAAVATSGKYSDLTGGPDLTPYAKTASLKAVATTGAFADLSGAPVLSKVATSGSFVDLSNVPVAAKLGAACGTGLVMKGIKVDGTYDCAAGASGPVEVKNLPADGIDEISNGLIFNQFNDSFAGATGTKIPDNNPQGVTDIINYPDIGFSQKLTVTIDVSNSNIAGLTLSLVDPDGVKYVLYAKGSAGVAVKTSYPLPTAPVSGDLTTWVGKNPKGAWKLTAVDSEFLNNTFDGAINSWSITSQTLSSKKIAVAGDLGVAGNLTAATINGLPASIYTAKQATYRWCNFNTYQNSQEGWLMNNDAAMFGGVTPGNWTNGNYTPANLSADKEVLRTLFVNKGYCGKNCNMISKVRLQYSSTDGDIYLAIFRIKNSNLTSTNWVPAFWYTSYDGWAEQAAVTLNGTNVWTSGGGGGTYKATPTVTLPANRTSTVIFQVSGSANYDWGYGVQIRKTVLAFYNDSLVLPAGVEYLDDLDTATGGWDK